LIGGLAFTEDDLGKTLTQRPVMIDPRERQIFEWEMPKPLERCVRSQAAAGHLGKQRLELLGRHAT
jgi:hypothetical protein